MIKKMNLYVKLGETGSGDLKTSRAEIGEEYVRTVQGQPLRQPQLASGGPETLKPLLNSVASCSSESLCSRLGFTWTPWFISCDCLNKYKLNIIYI